MKKTGGVQWKSHESAIWQPEEGRKGSGEIPGNEVTQALAKSLCEEEGVGKGMM